MASQAIQAAARARAQTRYESKSFGPGPEVAPLRVPTVRKPPQYAPGWEGEGRERPTVNYHRPGEGTTRPIPPSSPRQRRTTA